MRALRFVRATSSPLSRRCFGVLPRPVAEQWAVFSASVIRALVIAGPQTFRTLELRHRARGLLASACVLSPQADLAGGIVVGVIGVDALRHVKK